MIVAGLRAKAKSYFDGEQSRKAYAGASNSPQALKIRLLHPIATRAGAMRVFYNRQISVLEGEKSSLDNKYESLKSKNALLESENSKLCTSYGKLTSENAVLRNGFSEILQSAAISGLKYVKNPDPFDNKLNSLLRIKEVAAEFSEKKKE